MTSAGPISSTKSFSYRSFLSALVVLAWAGWTITVWLFVAIRGDIYAATSLTMAVFWAVTLPDSRVRDILGAALAGAGALVPFLLIQRESSDLVDSKPLLFLMPELVGTDEDARLRLVAALVSVLASAAIFVVYKLGGTPRFQSLYVWSEKRLEAILDRFKRKARIAIAVALICLLLVALPLALFIGAPLLVILALVIALI